MKHELRQTIFLYTDEDIEACQKGILSRRIKQKISSKIILEIFICAALTFIFAVLDGFLYFKEAIVLQQNHSEILVVC